MVLKKFVVHLGINILAMCAFSDVLDRCYKSVFMHTFTNINKYTPELYSNDNTGEL